MSAELNVTDGRVSFAYTNDHPWHKTGTRVSGLMTVAEAIVAGGLNWDVLKLTTKVVMPDGTLMEDPRSFATVRSDTKAILGRVSPDYQVIQNVEAFRAFDSAFGDGTATLETVGCLRQGETVFACARLPGLHEIIPGDPIEQWMLLSTSHDGSGACQVMFTPIRVVCRNTLMASLGRVKHRVSVRHTKGALTSLEDAHKALKAGSTYFDRAREFYRAAAKVPATGETVRGMLDAMFPNKVAEVEIKLAGVQAAVEQERLEAQEESNKKARDRITHLFEGAADGADMAGKTVWGLFNSATQWVDRDRTTRGGDGAQFLARWEASIYGQGHNTRQAATNYLYQQVVRS